MNYILYCLFQQKQYHFVFDVAVFALEKILKVTDGVVTSVSANSHCKNI